MKKLKVGGHSYKVIVTKMPEGENNLATTDYNTATITVDKTISVQSIRESTFIHEIFHTLNSTWGYTGTEHGLLDSLAEQLYFVLKENNLLNQKTLDDYLK